MEIARDLATRLLEHLADHARLGGLKAAELHAELSAALSSSARPLTAEECREIADRMELEEPVFAQPQRVARDLRIWASRLEEARNPPAEWLNAPAYHTPATPEDATQT